MPVAWYHHRKGFSDVRVEILERKHCRAMDKFFFKISFHPKLPPKKKMKDNKKSECIIYKLISKCNKKAGLSI